jgi:DNA-binding response OmpR family regulator
MPATILVVEDDAPTRTFLADNLTADGYELLVAENVQHRLRLLETRFPDLVLVDLGLPDGRATRCCAGCARPTGSRRASTPLVLLTDRAGELHRIRGFERSRAFGSQTRSQ